MYQAGLSPSCQSRMAFFGRSVARMPQAAHLPAVAGVLENGIVILPILAYMNGAEPKRGLVAEW